ncbi:hypothetical protein [Massilia horti]|uniref:Uncharacterized protein n=1 Tax=Massilia horti TaxID=2562153 RepID=A0A4Y9SY28_9BURK|nr:hypothetical protein [Massilia horti]TFW31759.1 hypothetical protein E4O92_12480 [Massilia horti]
MKEQIRLSLGRSARDFRNIVWPLILTVPLLNGGTLKPGEAAAGQESKDELDFLAGIDAWQLFTRTSVVRGIASRVQWKDCYQTFTVRVSRPNGGETEFQKRFDVKNKNNGHLYPYITVQAFLNGKGGRLLAAAAIKTEDLIEAVSDPHWWQKTAVFFSIGMGNLLGAGLNYHPESPV